VSGYDLPAPPGQRTIVGWDPDKQSYYAETLNITPEADPAVLFEVGTSHAEITDPADLCDALIGRIDIPEHVMDALLHDSAASFRAASVANSEADNEANEADVPEPDTPSPATFQIRGDSVGFLDSF
jgi:hypothetical protein